MEQTILTVTDLSISYGPQKAVDGVSFSVLKGEIFGLLGPNGAGKTSTLSAIEGLLKPDGGIVQVAGYDIYEDSLLARANLGIQLQATSFQQDLTVFEVLELYAGLYGIELSRDEILAALDTIRIKDASGKKVRELSGGQQQRLSLAISTIHNPPLVMLDEPTTGLDPQSRRQLWDKIERMKEEGRSILVTTHFMEEAYALCDRIAILDHGKIIAIGKPQELIDRHKDDPDVQAVVRKGIVTLEDVFIGLTGRAVRK